jgi:hypothetical protein
MFNDATRMWKVSWAMILFFAGGCQDYGFEELPSSVFISSHQIEDIPLNPVDILFVVDNSGSMAGEQVQLGQSFKNFYNVLNETGGSYHIALVTTGIESPSCKKCSDANKTGCINVNEAGDAEIENGMFQYRRGHFNGDENNPEFDFLYDESCKVVTSTNLNCFFNPNDNGVERGTVLVGTNGCIYERGLEAMYKALTRDLLAGPNQGFLREDSSLAVIIVSDEDDCGPVNYVNELFGNDVVCYHAANGESNPGQYVPLPPVANYRRFLLSLKGDDPSRVKFAAIVGLKPPANPGDAIDLVGTKIEFNQDQFDKDQQVKAVCSTCNFEDKVCSALPGTRYRDLYYAFGENGYIDTICQNDFSETMEKIAHFVSCPKFFDLVEAPLDIELANILVNGVAVPRDAWTYKSPAELLTGNPPVPEPPAGGRIVFENYDPCSLVTSGTLRIELVYVVE